MVIGSGRKDMQDKDGQGKNGPTVESKKIKVAVVGGSGYTGVELLRLLLDHPLIELEAVTSRTEAGRRLTEVFPQFYGHPKAQAAVFEAPDLDVLRRAQLVFFATPNGTAMQSAQALLNDGIKVIDLAADFRLPKLADWQEWYGMEHGAPDLLTQAVYGLADMESAAIRSARLVANPGCYPTSVQLALKPLLAAGLVDISRSIIADCKSGATGAGRSCKVQHSFTEISENFTAYGVEGHRHWIEIRNGLTQSAQTGLDFTFVPHLLPMPRGIFSTIYASLKQPGQAGLVEARHTLVNTYADSPFVQVLPAGEVPQTKAVRGSNNCQLNLFLARSGQLVLTSAIDNLMKGAAGQAVQNMNLMFDLPETAGLPRCGIAP